MNAPRRPQSAALRAPLSFVALALLATAVPAAAQSAGAAPDTARTPATAPDTARKGAPAPAPKQNGAAPPTVKLGGVVYAQYEYWLSDSIGHTNQFDVTRAYLNAIGSFSHGVTTRITADIYRNPAGPTSLNYRIKYAYFQWLPSATAPVDFRFGATQTPWLDWEETLYGLRMQGTMPMERAGFLTSSDLGLAMDFFTKDRGLLNGSIGAYNGEGYANAPGGKFLDYEARASVRLLKSDDASPQGGLRLTGYGHVGRVDVFGGPPRDRWIAQASYKSKLLLLAGEAGWAKTGLAPTTAAPNPPHVDARVLAAFGVLDIPGPAAPILLRVDRVNPNTAVTDTSSTRFIGGVAYRISPNLRLLGDVDAVSYDQTSPLPAALQAQKTKLLFQTEFTF